MARQTKYTKELLQPIVQESYSWAQVLRSLKLRPTGGNYRNIQGWVKYHKISFSHFRLQGWSKGETKFTHPSVNAASKKSRIPDKEVFKKNGHPLKSSSIAKRLRDEGRGSECEKCGIENVWNDVPLVMHLHHINGDHTDHRKKNLQLICPNCHSQTPSYGGLKNVS